MYSPFFSQYKFRVEAINGIACMRKTTNTPLFDIHHQQYTYTQGQIIYYIFFFFILVFCIRSQFGSMAEKKLHKRIFRKKFAITKLSVVQLMLRYFECNTVIHW